MRKFRRNKLEDLGKISLTTHNMQAQIYSWWLQQAFDLVTTIRGRMVDADDATKTLARASFQGFVKVMTSVVLPYLDRFYVRRYEVAGDASSSLPTVREIGRRAVDMLALPFDAPLPADAPCPEVPLTPNADVDEVELAQRQRRAWQQRDIERFDELMQHQLQQQVGIPIPAYEN